MCCTGPDHITFLLSLYDGVKLKDWNLSGDDPLEGPQWNGRPTYFVFYACANDIVPWDFWIDLEVKTIYWYIYKVNSGLFGRHQPLINIHKNCI